MKPLDILYSAIVDAGYNKTTLAQAMGRSKNYVLNYYTRHNMPKLDSYVSMLNACGYDVIVRSRKTGDEMVVTND